MAWARESSSTTALAIFLLCMTLVGQSYGQLKTGFYIGKCKSNNVEQVVFDVVNAAFQRDRTIVAALLRMQFHDCFVRREMGIETQVELTKLPSIPIGTKILAWNARGIARNGFKKNLKQLIRDHSPDLVILTETKVPRHATYELLESAHVNACEVVEPVGLTGGISILWNKSVLSFNTLAKDDRTIHGIVQGCDASLLLDGPNTEKTADSNGSVRGYELIDAIKARLEEKCPEVVSCADIIVIATRVSVFLAQGRWYSVETGRRDGVVSSATEAQSTLPGAAIPVPVAVDIFRRRGLSADDFVLLLGGGHTVGIMHCNFFLDRLYNFQGTGRPDPSMNRRTLSSFRRTCPRNGPNNFVFADQSPRSSLKVDNGYYKAIRQGKGVLQIDQQIASHRLTSGTVRRLSTTGDFAFQFGGAMVRLGRVGVLTGTQGQIRKNCRRRN